MSEIKKKIDEIINSSCENKILDYRYTSTYKEISRAIFICLDNNTLYGLIMVIQSLIMHNDIDNYVFNILTDDECYKKTLKIFKEIFKNLSYNIKIFDTKLINKIEKYFNNSCEYNPHCKNIMNYARFFYQNYFNEKYYLYTDTDILFNDSIEPFFNNLENNYINVVLNIDLFDAVRPKEEYKNYLENKYNLNFTSEGFNAGIYAINNTKSLEENHLNKIVDFMNDENNCFKFGTQPVVNIFYNKIKNGIENDYLIINNNKYSIWNYHDTWNFSNYDVVNNNFYKFKCVHFTGNKKPWDINCPYYNIFLNIISHIEL
jgi:lipopolysaccharide biosynthesis glycosyltransferase